MRLAVGDNGYHGRFTPRSRGSRDCKQWRDRLSDFELPLHLGDRLVRSGYACPYPLRAIHRRAAAKRDNSFAAVSMIKVKRLLHIFNGGIRNGLIIYYIVHTSDG
ncbi:hypothetical protein D3C76_1460730 [compost metagenome]